MQEIRYFVKDDGRKLPVSDEFLLPFLTPTSPGTNYWDSPPAGPITERRRGRVVLQLHQVLDLLHRSGLDIAGKNLLDIGTGTGLIPRLMLEFSALGSAVGAEPFPHGGHTASWQAHDEDEAFRDMRDFIHAKMPGALDYDCYRGILGYEHHTLRPARYPCQSQPSKNYRVEKLGAHDIGRLEGKFDLFYVKAIDHISDWAGIFRAVASVAADDAMFCIKHFSFFSYLGPHRYGTTNIPWGHLLLTDDEYRRFAQEFHGQRAEKMIKFYFEGLSYPRTPMSGLLRIAREHGFLPMVVINEPLRNLLDFQHLTNQVDGFWDMVSENFPNLSAEEMFSGRYHVVLRRMADA